MSIADFWPWALAALDIALAGAVTVHAVLRKRDVRAAIAWTGLAWLAPFLGTAAYFWLGVNRIQRKAIKLGVHHALQDAPRFDYEQADIDQASQAREAHPNFAGLAALGRAQSGKTLLPGNRIDCLIDGDQTYPAMVDQIARAERSISLLSYIFDSDRAGDAIVDALVAAHGRRVEIRVLIDGVGARYSKENIATRLLKSGINAALFLPPRFAGVPVFTNLRNHRKILVVDGRTGFTGGTNIREAHWLSLDPAGPTKCLHFRLEGPVVAHLQEAFVTDWAFTTGEQLSGPRWFPQPARAGDIWARGIVHGPDEDFEALSKVMFAGLSVARDRVRIVSPYFLPDARLIEGLSVAALRGVEVEIYLPSNNNLAIVEWACAAQLGLILENGCRVFVTPPPFDHTKLMIVDGTWSLFGSTNWDPRSLRLNFEFNVECYDYDLASRLHAIIDSKARGAREITLDQINSRSFPVRMRDGLARLLSPYL
jgi:cardiolipin synthase